MIESIISTHVKQQLKIYIMDATGFVLFNLIYTFHTLLAEIEELAEDQNDLLDTLEAQGVELEKLRAEIAAMKKLNLR